MAKSKEQQAKEDYEGTPVESPLDAAIQETTNRQDNLAMMQMRMEHESIVSQTKVAPRDMVKMKAEADATLKAFPEFASDAIYVKPVGSVFVVPCTNTKCKFENEESYIPRSGKIDCDRCGQTISVPNQYALEKRKKFASGLSIRAAEMCAELYRYNQVSSRIVPLDEEHVSVEAMFIDYQNGRKWSDSGILSKYYTQAGTKNKTLINADRFANIICKAEASKRIREVILRCVAAPFKAWLEHTCREIQRSLLTDEKITQIVEQFATKGVTTEMLVKFIGRTQTEGWTITDRERLAGAWSAIKNGDGTIREIFGDEDDAPSSGSEQGPGTEPAKNLSGLAKQAKAASGSGTTTAQAEGAVSKGKESEPGKNAVDSAVKTPPTGKKSAEPSKSSAPADDPGPQTQKEEVVEEQSNETAEAEEVDDSQPTADEAVQVADIKKQLAGCSIQAEIRQVYDGWSKLPMRPIMKQFLQQKCIKRALVLCKYKEDVTEIFMAWSKVALDDETKTMFGTACDELEPKLESRPKAEEPKPAAAAKKKVAAKKLAFGDEE